MPVAARTLLGAALLGAALLSGPVFASSHREAPPPGPAPANSTQATPPTLKPISVRRAGYANHTAVVDAAATPQAPIAPVAPAAPTSK